MTLPSPPSAPDRDAPPEQQPILIVDDRPENLLALAAVLEPLGARIVTATSGDDALRRLLTDEFALILLDVQMPGIDGFVTASMIKQHPRTAHIPIIFLTAFDERLDLAARGYSSGAVDYIAKPFDAWILRSKVQVFLDLHRKTVLLEQQTRRLEAHVHDLNASRRDLADAQRIARIGSWELDLATRRVRGSEQLNAILGLPSGSALTYDALRKCIGGDDDTLDAALDDLRARATIERATTLEDGRLRHVVVTIEPDLDVEGRAHRLIGTVQDVTEQREAAAALARAEQELRRERELVDLLQRSVAPVDVPEIPEFDVASRYLAAGPGIVGGDWYDVVPLHDGTAFLVIGDVAGHGLEAASAMAQIRTALRVVALTMHTPSGVLQQINRFLAVSASPVFATMLIVRCDPGSGACSAASAGHLPPVVCADVPRVQWVTAGPPLGSGLSARYHDTSFTLDADQTLLLYTDGLVERRGELLDDGLERLVSVIRCCEYDSGELADSIVSALCEPETTRDDVALLAVRRRGLSPELDLTLVADPARLSQVRMTIERWLSSVETEPSVLNDVVLAVSELATNVCLHAYPSFSRGPLHITGRVEGDDVHLIVRDEGRWRAEPSPHGGRGIPLLRALGFDVSFDRSDNGTAVRVIAARRPSQCEAI